LYTNWQPSLRKSCQVLIHEPLDAQISSSPTRFPGGEYRLPSIPLQPTFLVKCARLTGDQTMRMMIRAFGLSLLLLTGLIGTSFLAAQDSPKQDIKDAGHETKEAAKDTGRATKHAAKKTGRAVKRGTHKAAEKPDEGDRKVKDKTDPN